MNILDIASSDFFELSKENLFKQFEFSSADFKLNILSVKLLVDSQIDWQRLLSKFQIRVYVLCQDLEYSVPIHLFIDPNNIEPLFLINKLVDRHVFESDISLDSLSKIIVKIELREKQTIVEPFALRFNFSPAEKNVGF
ncbi:MAG: hypothetical protein CUR34_05945 [Sediminibacterium sp.]|nr:MAG: hypothetical protein CUR34_05945 [Sediminibacterium sp.] [Sediminibacterium sp. FEMGT703S]